jgi:hypothetical protein
MNPTGRELINDFRTLVNQRKRGSKYVDPKLVSKLNSVIDNEVLMKRIKVMDEYSNPLKFNYDESMPLQLDTLTHIIGDDGNFVEWFWELPLQIKKNKAYLLKNR